MKIIKSIFVMLMSVVFISCGGGDESSVDAKKVIHETEDLAKVAVENYSVKCEDKKSL